ncbi:MAG: sigma 54-interacting transcriptional regulator, partial [Saccharospirillum sp.]
GAFTGAGKTTEGRIEQANSGTLFLDEIGDMPLPLQAKLLRFLQERVIERVGGRKAISIDARVICATNKDLKSMVTVGKFREDLYYRICEIVVDIPPLRNRGTDARLLAKFFLQKYSRSMKQRSMRFSDDALAGIDSYEWPGNIREVENKVKRAVVLADNYILTAEDLDLKSEGDDVLNLNLRKIRQSAEVEAIDQALALSDYNVSMAAKMLGVTRPTLYDLIKKYTLNTDKKAEEDPL